MIFEFTIPGMTKEQAEQLMHIITYIVELLGLQLAGGAHEQEETE